MTDIMQKLALMLIDTLDSECPQLSGNMHNNINITSVSDNEITFCIDPTPYDVGRWTATGEFVFFNGSPSYANDVNQHGGFFTENESKGWANRACRYACDIVANEFGAEVENV